MSRRPERKKRPTRKIDKKSVIVYWLVPAKAERELFREIVRILAKQFDAPTFEPHLTLGLAQDRQSAQRVLRRLKASPIRLRLRGISHSSKFTKTLFVRFGPNKSLGKLIVDLGCKSVRDPHVSLLYQNMSILTRRELARTIRLPFREVAFTSIKAVRCVSPTTTRADVKSWRVVATKRLSA